MSTLARPPIHNQVYPEKLSTASPGKPAGITKPILLILFVQQDKNSLEESTSLEGTYFLTKFGKKPMRKIRSEFKLALNPPPPAVHIAYSVLQFE